MKINSLMVRILAVAAVLLLCSSQAWANPIPLGQSTTLANSGDGTIQNWLKQVVTDYNTTNGTSLPTDVIGEHPDLKVVKGDSAPAGYPTFEEGTLSIELPTDQYYYLVLHWGGNLDVHQGLGSHHGSCTFGRI